MINTRAPFLLQGSSQHISVYRTRTKLLRCTARIDHAMAIHRDLAVELETFSQLLFAVPAASERLEILMMLPLSERIGMKLIAEFAENTKFTELLDLLKECENVN